MTRILVILAVAAALTACGKKGDPKPPQPAKTETEKTATE
ncbi:MAG: lipoprotein [Pseudomonadota bacterium]